MADSSNPDNRIKVALFHKRYNLRNDDGITIDEARRIAESAQYVSIPIYFYDHNGLYISPEIEPTWWHYAWDGGQLGIAYVSVPAAGILWGEHRSVTGIVQILQDYVREHYVSDNVED